VLDVVARSGVARSTFYEHFQSREDLLRESMRGPFETLAQLALPGCDLARVASMLDHFMQNRTMAKSLMANPGTDALVEVLSEILETRCGVNVCGTSARAAAGAQMALISSWLDGKEKRTARDLAQVLRGMSLALIAL
jgi:AcrR family transcriptional regulator